MDYGKFQIDDLEMQRIISEVIDRYLIPKFRSYDMNATGEWLSTIEARNNSIWGRSYTEQLVDGREPGNMPPVNAIKEWVVAKMGSSGKQAEDAAWAIATKIKQEGTNWHQKGGTDLLKVLEDPEVTRFINEEIRKVITANVQEEIIKDMKLTFSTSF